MVVDRSLVKGDRVGAVKRYLVHDGHRRRLHELCTSLVLEVRVSRLMAGALTESIPVGVREAFFHRRSSGAQNGVVENRHPLLISFNVEILRILCF